MMPVCPFLISYIEPISSSMFDSVTKDNGYNEFLPDLVLRIMQPVSSATKYSYILIARISC